MEIKIDINISSNKVTITTKDSNINNYMEKQNIPSRQKPTIDVTKTDYLEYDDLLDRDDMNTILEEYFMYRGLLGSRIKYGRLFNEISKFDNEAEEQFGYIEEIKEKLMLTSEEGANNFIEYVDAQKRDIDKLTVCDCVSMIGFCSLVLDVWRKERQFSRWKYCIHAIKVFIDDYMLDKVKTMLQNRLVYVEMS
ncbi:toll/il-1 receptor-like protein [Skunkpox virus]|uniref:Toll/il-1 receptor-like protein n=1 Tax=Skunkpox virus TaxID=160796 RepID=A0A1C9KBW6_9POXV|nr:toll/il-1 receptor-like protein [Skunkpox virus]AOP31652.1 toll/il-1 receptor-like protein [Skunkpox virus]